MGGERNFPAGAVFAVLGPGAIDVLVLLPILLLIAGVLLAFFMIAVALFTAGAIGMVAGPFWVLGAPVAAVILTASAPWRSPPASDPSPL